MSADRPKFTRDKFIEGAAAMALLPQISLDTDSADIRDHLTMAKISEIQASAASRDILWLLVQRNQGVRDTTPKASQLTTTGRSSVDQIREMIDSLTNPLKTPEMQSIINGRRRDLSQPPTAYHPQARFISDHQVVKGQLLPDGRITFQTTTSKLPFYTRGITTSPTDASQVMVFGDDGLINTGSGQFKRQQRMATSGDGVSWIDQNQDEAPGQSLHLFGEVSDNGKWGFITRLREDKGYLEYFAIDMESHKVSQLYDRVSRTPKELILTTPRVQADGKSYEAYGIHFNALNVTVTQFRPEALDPKTAITSISMSTEPKPLVVWKDYFRNDGSGENSEWNKRLILKTPDSMAHPSSPADRLDVTDTKLQPAGPRLFIKDTLRRLGFLNSEPSYTAITGLVIDNQTKELFAMFTDVDRGYKIRSGVLWMPNVDLQNRAQILSNPSLGWPESEAVPQNMTILRRGSQRVLTVVFKTRVVTKVLSSPNSSWITNYRP